MFNQDSVRRLDDKSPLHTIQIELQHGYAIFAVLEAALGGKTLPIVPK